MRVGPGEEVQYELLLGQYCVSLNSLVGSRVRLSFLGEISCQHCGKLTKKSWQQGYCYPCTLKLAACDMCILKPETCHYAMGTCREPTWGETHCLRPHVVYLANTSGLKVGITREAQVPTRWLDQGAVQAMPVLKVPDRLTSGLVEKLLGAHVSDKTAWQKMLQGSPPLLDLASEWERLRPLVTRELDLHAYEEINSGAVSFHYPVKTWPLKAKSISLEKTPVVEDELTGIKGQYLMFSSGALNVRSHTGHLVRWEQL